MGSRATLAGLVSLVALSVVGCASDNDDSTMMKPGDGRQGDTGMRNTEGMDRSDTPTNPTRGANSMNQGGQSMNRSGTSGQMSNGQMSDGTMSPAGSGSTGTGGSMGAGSTAGSGGSLNSGATGNTR